MHGRNKKHFHKWARTVTFQEVLNECELCDNGIMCVYCESFENVYMATWNGDIDYFCENCLKEFINNEIPTSVPTGDLRKRFLVFSRDNFKCVYCGRNPRDHDTTLEIEHVHPKSKGGTDSLENLVTSCRECNAGKGDYILNKRNKETIFTHRR